MTRLQMTISDASLDGSPTDPCDYLVGFTAMLTIGTPSNRWVEHFDVVELALSLVANDCRVPCSFVSMNWEAEPSFAVIPVSNSWVIQTVDGVILGPFAPAEITRALRAFVDEVDEELREMDLWSLESLQRRLQSPGGPIAGALARSVRSIGTRRTRKRFARLAQRALERGGEPS